MSRRFPFACLLCVFFLACGSDAPQISQSEAPPPPGRPAYGAYVSGVENGDVPVVLFFASDDDPFSKKTDAVIHSLFRSDAPVVPVYKTPMTLDIALLRSLGVYIENTVVLIDGRGGRSATIVHPSEQELRTLLITGKAP